MHKIVFFIALALGAHVAHAQERGYAGLALGTSKFGVVNSAGQRVEHHNDVLALKGYAGLTERVRSSYRRAHADGSAGGAGAELTRREIGILALMAGGLSNAEIGAPPRLSAFHKPMVEHLMILHYHYQL